MRPESFFSQPLFGVTVTLLAYIGAQQIRKRIPLMILNPALVSGLALIGFLAVTGISYQDYKVGGDFITFILGPATVALGVPLYKQSSRIKSSIVPILSGITIGSISAMVSAAALVWAFGGSKDVLLAMIPKSATSPVSIEIVRHLGGIPELGAVFTVLAGVLGSLIGPEFMRLCRVRADTAIGNAIGTASHGIGTSRLIKDSEIQGSLSGFAMAVNSILTSLLITPLYIWFH